MSARAPSVGLAGALLMHAVLGGALLGGALLGVALRAAAPGLAYAGPLEAREAWKRAQALRDGPWRARLTALRQAVEQAAPGDSLAPRALAAQADLLRALSRVHAAFALDAWAARALARHDPDRPARLLDGARALLAEGDRVAAQALLAQAADEGRRATPWRADEALELLVSQAGEEGDAPRLAGLAVRAERERARASTRIEAWGALGLARLAQGDGAGARASLQAAARAYRASAREDPRDQARAAEAWLDLALRRRLAR